MAFPFQLPGNQHNGRNPTLLPNFDRPYANNGTVTLTPSPELASELGNGVPSEGSVTIAGTVASGDVISLELANGVLNPSVKVSYTATSTDTLATIAANLAAQINANSTLRSFGFWADDNGDGEVKVYQRGPVGNFTVLTPSTTEGETFTTAQMTGGSGPIVPLSNFIYTNAGVVRDYWYGLPFKPSYYELSNMVAQGLPVS